MPDHTAAVGMARKLAAIFSTDVAGYSRLMGDDEEATIRTLTASRALISSLIQHYRGRVVDAPGDNLLADIREGQIRELAISKSASRICVLSSTRHEKRWSAWPLDELSRRSMTSTSRATKLCERSSPLAASNCCTSPKSRIQVRSTSWLNCLDETLRGCLRSQEIKSLRAQRSNLCPKKRLLRRLRLLAMTLANPFSDSL